MDADKETTLQNSFISVARRLKLAITNYSDAEDIRFSFIQWLQTHDGWLLVFDNADDFSLGNTTDALRLQKRYFPMTGRGAILMTTRNGNAGPNGSPINMYDFQMDEDTALKLLLGKDVNLSNVSAHARDLVKELEYLPLAIDIAGASMRMDRTLTPETYLKNCRDNFSLYLESEDLSLEDRIELMASDYPKTVLTVWIDTFDRIKKRNLLADDLLRSMALLHPDNIPLGLFYNQAAIILASENIPNRLSLIKLLQDFALIRKPTQEDPALNISSSDTSGIHRLVQKVILRTVGRPEILQRCERLVTALGREMPVFSDYDEHFRTAMEARVPHIQHLCKQLAIEKQTLSDLDGFLPLLSPAVVYLVHQALLEDAKELVTFALNCSRNAKERSDQGVAAAESISFYLCAMQRDFADAELYGTKALEMRASTLGLHDKKTRSSLHYLAYIYDCSGKKDKATLLYKRAADAGDFVAIRELARRYRYGVGTQSDFNAAHLYEKKLRDQPDAQLQRDFYEYGRIDLTPLHYALLRKDLEGLQKHVDKYRPFADIGDEDGRTPLHLAVEMGLEEFVRLLLETLKVSTNVKDNNGLTPTMNAILNGYMEIAECINKGPVRILDFTGMTMRVRCSFLFAK